MAFYDYRFVTHWRIRGPISVIYDILKEGQAYSRWWKLSYVSSETVGVGKIRCLVRAWLPYTLQFTTELLQENPPYEFAVEATGDLVGTGVWKLKQEGEDAVVEFHWNVRASKSLVKWLSLFLKPVFAWNHAWVMKKGKACLRQEVARVLLSRNGKGLDEQGSSPHRS